MTSDIHIHEAAHAVLSHQFGQRVYWLRAVDGGAGQVMRDVPPCHAVNYQILMAGPLAQDRYCGEVEIDLADDGAVLQYVHDYPLWYSPADELYDLDDLRRYRRNGGNHFGLFALYGSPSDYEKAIDSLVRHHWIEWGHIPSNQTIVRLWRWLENSTHRQLDREWPHIERVASALAGTGFLSGQEFARLMGRATGKPN